jgi:signal transduction histidine kinase
MSQNKRSWPDYLALAGALVGLAGGLFLGGLRLLNSETPQLRAEWAGDLVFTLIYLAPFILSLVAFRWPKPVWRAAVWGAATILALLGAVTAFSGVSLVLLPAALLLAPAALATLAQAPPRLWPATILIAAALVVLVAGAFFLLMAGPEDGRCWELVREPGGEAAWRTAPFSQSGVVSTSATGDELGVLRVLCSSDVLTAAEAGMGLLALLAAGLLVAWLEPRWPPVQQSTI